MSFAAFADPSRKSDDVDPYAAVATLPGLESADPAGDPANPDAPPDAVDEPQIEDRHPVPLGAELEATRELYRDIFYEQYKAAGTSPQKRDLAKKILDALDEVADDMVARYVLLDAARRVATEGGGFETAREAIDELMKDFIVDDYHLNVELVRGCAASSARATDERMEFAIDVAKTAITRDDFETAVEIQRLAAADYKELNPRAKTSEELVRLRRRIEAAKNAYNKARKALEYALDDSPEAHLITGQYYCFVKQDWRRGLALLAKGSNRDLKDLATFELSRPADPGSMLDIAEAWWKYGDVYIEHADEIRRHAMLWLLMAEDRMPDGLRLTASRRRRRRRRSRRVHVASLRIERLNWLRFDNGCASAAPTTPTPAACR